MLPGKSNANDELDSDMPEIDSEFGDRYVWAESDELDDFLRLDIWGKLKNMCGKRTGKEKTKYVRKTILDFMLLTKALSHNAVLDTIMQNVDTLQANYSMGLDEALEHAVSMHRILIRNKLADSAKETEIDDSKVWVQQKLWW